MIALYCVSYLHDIEGRKVGQTHATPLDKPVVTLDVDVKKSRAGNSIKKISVVSSEEMKVMFHMTFTSTPTDEDLKRLGYVAQEFAYNLKKRGPQSHSTSVDIKGSDELSRKVELTFYARQRR